MDDTERYVIHLSVQACDLAGAMRLARVVARSTSFLSHIDPHATTVSVASDGVWHRVFCDLRLPDGRTCLLATGHQGPCARRVAR